MADWRCVVIAHWTHAGLCEALGWGVVWAAALFAAARYAEAGTARLARRVRRAAAVVAAYARTRAAAMRRPHRHAHRARRPHPRLAALLLAAHLTYHRYIHGGTR